MTWRYAHLTVDDPRDGVKVLDQLGKTSYGMLATGGIDSNDYEIENLI